MSPGATWLWVFESCYQSCSLQISKCFVFLCKLEKASLSSINLFTNQNVNINNTFQLNKVQNMYIKYHEKNENKILCPSIWIGWFKADFSSVPSWPRQSTHQISWFLWPGSLQCHDFFDLTVCMGSLMLTNTPDSF